ncbi:hypothetical protein PS15p_212312 [Mucor circinelloides]
MTLLFSAFDSRHLHITCVLFSSHTMVIWFFENNHFANAWIPFDRSNQKKLEYVYRHHEEIIRFWDQKKNDIVSPLTTDTLIDLDEEDDSVHPDIQYDHNCIYINLKDSHFEHAITLYPIMLLGSLPDRDILILRAEMMDHKNNKYLLE